MGKYMGCFHPSWNIYICGIMMNHDWLGSFMFFQSAFIYRVMTGKKNLPTGGCSRATQGRIFDAG